MKVNPSFFHSNLFHRSWEIGNCWEGNELTKAPRGRVLVKSGTIGNQRREWLRSGQFLAAHDGKVLTSNGVGRPVTLEYANPFEERQKWSIDRFSGHDYLIKQGNNYLDLLGNFENSNVVNVGLVSTRRTGRHRFTSLWKMFPLEVED